MVAKLSDLEFNELKQTFDPEGTGVVKISSLLDTLDDSPKVGSPQSLDWVTPKARKSAFLAKCSLNKLMNSHLCMFSFQVTVKRSSGLSFCFLKHTEDALWHF